MKSSLRDIWKGWRRGLALRLASGLGQRLRPPPSPTLGILAYHRIAPCVVGQPAPTYNVTPDRFRRQIQGLLESGFCPWSLSGVLQRMARGEGLPPRAFVVTFDDGYECLYTQAYPILQELRVPATIFLATAYLDDGRPFLFDDWAATGSSRVPADTWRPLRSAQCAAMLASDLIELGSHTHTHADFRGQPQLMEDEVRTSLDVLHSRFGLEKAAFAYPFGAVDAGLVAAVRRAGATCALTTANNLVRPESDLFAWGRITTVQSDTPQMLAAALEGRYEHLRTAWRRLRRWPHRWLRRARWSTSEASGVSPP